MAGRKKSRWIQILTLAGLAVFAAAATVSVALYAPDRDSARPGSTAALALGRQVYADHCAACHGENLQGQPNWQIRGENGRLPAPPHDASGHTWHHPDEVLFAITKLGTEALAGAGYQSDMPAFEDQLSDAEIWAALAYIKSTWPPDIQARQEEISRRAAADN